MTNQRLVKWRMRRPAARSPATSVALDGPLCRLPRVRRGSARRQNDRRARNYAEGSSKPRTAFAKIGLPEARSRPFVTLVGPKIKGALLWLRS